MVGAGRWGRGGVNGAAVAPVGATTRTSRVVCGVHLGPGARTVLGMVIIPAVVVVVLFVSVGMGRVGAKGRSVGALGQVVL